MALLVYLALALAAFAAVSAQSQCPGVACTTEFRPGMTHAPAVMVYKNEVCEVCRKWVDPAVKIDRKTGCPVVPCTLMALRPGCSRNVYFSWDGKLCPDCAQEFC